MNITIPVINYTFEIRAVWLTIIVFVGTAIISTVLIVMYSDLHRDFSYHGFNKFIEIFRFPLGIFAVMIPVVALLVANYRAEQTKVQIREMKAQNNFANYLAHKNDFVKMCDEFTPEKGFHAFAEHPRQVYEKLYPDANKGNLDFWKEMAVVIINNTRIIEKKVAQIAETKVLTLAECLNIERCIWGMFTPMGIGCGGKEKWRFHPIDTFPIFLNDGTVYCYVQFIQQRLRFVEQITVFERDISLRGLMGDLGWEPFRSSEFGEGISFIETER